MIITIKVENPPHEDSTHLRRFLVRQFVGLGFKINNKGILVSKEQVASEEEWRTLIVENNDTQTLERNVDILEYRNLATIKSAKLLKTHVTIK
jgi:hypothetical protein